MQGGKLVADEWQLSWTASGSNCSARALLSHILINPPLPLPPAGTAVSPAETGRDVPPLPVPLIVALQVEGSCTVALLADGPAMDDTALQGPLRLEELGSVRCQSLKVSIDPGAGRCDLRIWERDGMVTSWYRTTGHVLSVLLCAHTTCRPQGKTS